MYKALHIKRVPLWLEVTESLLYTVNTTAQGGSEWKLR
jgi:hypothetical protein